MSGIWGSNIKVSIFGESHGSTIGITISGLTPGLELNMDNILREMKRRAPGRNSLATARKEDDIPEILSGVFEGSTTGAPLCAIIRNSDTRSKDYGNLKSLMRPGHGDYPGKVRYKGFNDYRGGGHFSGRITASLVFAGAICKQYLEKMGIYIGAHISSIGNIKDEEFDLTTVTKNQLERLNSMELPLINSALEGEMRDAILKAKNEGDSIGGTVQCAIIGLEAGIGNPFFDSIESTLAHLMFSIPAIKGIEFGKGFEMASGRGSEYKDEYYYDGDKIRTKANNNGGILGGITNGMPVVFRVAVKPTSSILMEQHTVDISKKENTILKISGRHDPCIVQRALPVVEAATAIGLLDLIKGGL